jgi:hypothetical protein
MGMFSTISKKMAFRIALSMVALAFLLTGMLFVVCFNKINLIYLNGNFFGKVQEPHRSARRGPRSSPAAGRGRAQPVPVDE